MSNTTPFKLKHPFTAKNGDQYTSLELRRPKGKDFRQLPQVPKTGDILNLAADLANVPPFVIDELDVVDVLALIEVVQTFLDNIPATGAKP